MEVRAERSVVAVHGHRRRRQISALDGDHPSRPEAREHSDRREPPAEDRRLRNRQAHAGKRGLSNIRRDDRLHGAGGLLASAVRQDRRHLGPRDHSL